MALGVRLLRTVKPSSGPDANASIVDQASASIFGDWAHGHDLAG